MRVHFRELMKYRPDSCYARFYGLTVLRWDVVNFQSISQHVFQLGC